MMTQPLTINPNSWHFRLYNQWYQRQILYNRHRPDSRCGYIKIVLGEALRDAIIWFFTDERFKVGRMTIYPWTLFLAGGALAMLWLSPQRVLSPLLLMATGYMIPLLGRYIADEFLVRFMTFNIIIATFFTGALMSLTGTPISETIMFVGRVSVSFLLIFYVLRFLYVAYTSLKERPKA